MLDDPYGMAAPMAVPVRGATVSVGVPVPGDDESAAALQVRVARAIFESWQAADPWHYMTALSQNRLAAAIVAEERESR